jgi:hypothetical protein
MEVEVKMFAPNLVKKKVNSWIHETYLVPTANAICGVKPEHWRLKSAENYDECVAS